MPLLGIFYGVAIIGLIVYFKPYLRSKKAAKQSSQGGSQIPVSVNYFFTRQVGHQTLTFHASERSLRIVLNELSATMSAVSAFTLPRHRTNSPSKMRSVASGSLPRQA